MRAGLSPAKSKKPPLGVNPAAAFSKL